VFGFPLIGDNYERLDNWGKKINLVQYGMAGQKTIALSSTDKYRIGYEISTMKGQSGSPIVSREKIIAIHNGGGRPDEEFNVGRMVTADLIASLLKWR
jgi:V8-like Glu-specific endopeptidase